MSHTSIQISGEQVPAVLALPPAGSGPAVIVIQEWWGLVPHIVAVTERLAQAGFVAMAVDHYRGAATTEPDEAGKLMMGLDIEQMAADLAAAADHLLGQPQVSSSSVGVVGFCMGGGLALLAPTVSDGISCASAFYPAMPWPHYAPDWSRYAGKAAIVHKAVSDEPGTGPVIAEYAAAIAAAGGEVELFEYPDSVHAFFNDDRPEVYQRANADRAWERTVGFLREHLG